MPPPAPSGMAHRPPQIKLGVAYEPSPVDWGGRTATLWVRGGARATSEVPVPPLGVVYEPLQHTTPDPIWGGSWATTYLVGGGRESPRGGRRHL
jgi:hypothetical protein